MNQRYFHEKVKEFYSEPQGAVYSSLVAYFKTVGTLPLLTEEEEITLAKRIKEREEECKSLVIKWERHFHFGELSGEIVRETVLIVDYRQNLRTLYDLELSEEGYRILLAEDEDGAIRILKDECPDLVVIDGELLLSEGTVPLERLRSFCSQTLIVINDVAHDACKKLLCSFLVDDCLIKSSDLDHFKEKIKELLKKKQCS